MPMTRRRLIAVSVAGVVALVIAARALTEPLPPRTAKLFADAPRDVRAIAARIEKGEVPSVEEIRATGHVNTRYADDIALLYFALLTANVAATGPLIAAGADYDMPARTRPGAGNYIDLIAMPGGSLLSAEELDEAVRLYLETGGNPNALGRSGQGKTLLARLATNRRMAAVRLVVAAGGDVLARHTRSGEKTWTPFSSIAINHSDEAIATIDWLIDGGYLTNLPQEVLAGVIDDLASYAPRGDAITRENQRLGMRILKRNPHYQPPDSDNRGSRRLFKDHYDDPPARIPWDMITSDAVK
ncbi:hypothetical protein LV82_01586 [Albidovulum inexpectatum]|uniref:Uncharacterized protein n=1 Tax=Albidovulum inexpectatum TaxID=196587 RepID=A0A2S5JH99_9RHOB|nr:hypothetical protein [Albidovulum inexpectatum]PPB80853.1 hypothetical protein LV82_01586 [Albidovulum inexpectatum]